MARNRTGTVRLLEAVVAEPLDGAGVALIIVLMNIITPLIERYVKPTAFGKPKEKKKKEGAA